MIRQVWERCRKLKTVTYLDMGESVPRSDRRTDTVVEIPDRFMSNTGDFDNFGRELSQLRFGTE